MSAPVITTRTLWHLDTDLLLASGAMEGPYTRPRPVLGWLHRLTRRIENYEAHITLLAQRLGRARWK